MNVALRNVITPSPSPADPNSAEECDGVKIIRYVDEFFTVVFAIEAVLKMIAGET